MSSPPPGFVLDQPSGAQLPPGFVLDEASQTQESSPGGGLGFLNQGIATTLGAPVDLMNWGLGHIGLGSEEPFLGSGSITRGMRALGVNVADPDAQPESLGEYVGRGMGGAAGALLPGAGVVGAMGRGGPVAQGVAQTVSRPFTATPGRALAAETMAGAGAGVGESVASQLAPDSPLAQMAGALTGGIAGGMGPAAMMRMTQKLPLAGTAIRMAQSEIAPFTEAGAMERARRRVGGLVEDKDAAIRNIDGGSIADLSPAVMSGDRRLMALEQAVRSQEPSADLRMREAEMSALQVLREEIVTPAQGMSGDATRAFLDDRVAMLVDRMNTRVRTAQERARDRVAQLEPEQGMADASIIVREELEGALQGAGAQERAIWSSLPQGQKVPTQGVKQRYDEIVRSLGRVARREDIPPNARDFLEGDGNQVFKAQESVREMHSLYSDLRRTARNSRAGDTPNRNMARIADDLADAILDDMASAPNVSRPLREALDFSRQLNETFRRGSIGRVLGSERTGGDRVPDIQTLDQTIGRGGRAGAVSVDEIRGAVPDSPQAERAMQDYIAGRFQDAAVRDGELRPGPAGTFARGQRDVLERMPQMDRRIRDALQSSEAADRLRSVSEKRIRDLETRSAASTLTGARPGEEIRSILRSRNPRQTAAQLVRQARRDPTGEASLGLKGALIDDLMSQSRRADFDEAGQAMLSGRRIKRLLNEGPTSGVAVEILSPTERVKMHRIADELVKVETMQSRLPDVGPIMGDEPNSVVGYLARVLAARSGAQLGQGTSGASLQAASMASTRMQRILQRLTNDKAEQLIIKAVTGDQDLFRSLLVPGSRMTRKQETRLYETLVGIMGSETAGQGRDDQSPLQIDVLR